MGYSLVTVMWQGLVLWWSSSDTRYAVLWLSADMGYTSNVSSTPLSCLQSTGENYLSNNSQLTIWCGHVTAWWQCQYVTEETVVNKFISTRLSRSNILESGASHEWLEGSIAWGMVKRCDQRLGHQVNRVVLCSEGGSSSRKQTAVSHVSWDFAGWCNLQRWWCWHATVLPNGWGWLWSWSNGPYYAKTTEEDTEHLQKIVQSCKD